MDTFTEPYVRDEDIAPLPDVRKAISLFQDAHRANDTPLSGRIVQVSHYLPVVPTFAGPSKRHGLPSPPDTPTPPASPSTEGLPPAAAAAPTANATPAAHTGPHWTIANRSGHDAMVSGMRSLSATHEQVWVGWTGDVLAAKDGRTIPTDTLSVEDRTACEDALARFKGSEGDQQDDQQQQQQPQPKPMTLKAVWLPDKVAHKHYEGYSKRTLWPLFHYLLWQDVASEISTDDSEWEAYVHANNEYAKALMAIYQPGDLIWVHDYHLLLLPKILRQLLPDAHIGLFIHTPFPSSEVFRCLPRRREILDGMLGANLVCFQTYSYSRHFTSSCIRVCGYESSPKGIEVDGHITAVSHCPVGIDAERVARDTLRPGISPKLEALNALYEGKKIIVGRDKLDVVRGVLHKLRAFEKLLTDYPQWRNRAVFIQVTSPALSDSPKLERQISELVSRINGEFGSLDFIPVHHYHQHIKKDEFYALLSVADLGVITPLRDGMNTTSMEFVIAQRKTKNSPLVLSEFMGITGFMKDALQVNPWNLGDVAAAMDRGLTMPAPEKARRQEGLYKIVTTHTSHHWAANLVKMLLERLGAENARHHRTPVLDVRRMRDVYQRARKRLLLFDYDGTLTPIVRVPSQAIPSQHTLRTLERLAADPANIVYIISGRDASFLLQHLGDIGALGLSAEHGCFVREPGSTEWVNLAASLGDIEEWMEEVKAVFEYYTERTTGSTVEVKKSSVTWHYRGADPEWGQFQCRQCLDLLENNLVHKRPIEVLVGKKNLEVRPVAVNKGEIVKRILYMHPDAEFVFCAGDDKTDEDMFRALNLPPAINDTLTMPPPVSAAALVQSHHHDHESTPLEPVEIRLRHEGTFSTMVAASSKKTLARWHVTSPAEVVDAMVALVGEEDGEGGAEVEGRQQEGHDGEERE